MAKNLIPVDLEDSSPDNTVGALPDIPDDNYLFQVENFESDVDENDRRWYRVTTYIANDCAYKGTTFTEKFTFPADSEDDYSKKGRDRFHAWLLAIGMDIQKRKFGLDPENIRGNRFWSRTYHHTMPESADGRFKERQYSRMGPFSPYEEEDAKRMASRLPSKARRNEDDDDLKPAKASKRAAKDEEEDEEDELATRRTKKISKVEVEEEEEDEKPARRRKPAVDDDEEEEEDEKPVRRAVTKPPVKRGRKPVVTDDDEEEEDDEEAVFPTRPTKASKVIAKGKKRAAIEDDDEDED